MERAKLPQRDPVGLRPPHPQPCHRSASVKEERSTMRATPGRPENTKPARSRAALT